MGSVTVATAVALALPLAGCGSNSATGRSATTTGTAPAALIAASNGFIAAVERTDAAAVCSFFTRRGRAYIVADAHSRATCTQVLATVFKRGDSILNYRPVGAARVIGVQSYGSSVIISYLGAGGRGDTIPWVKTHAGWKVDRTG
ncbi:MAG: hypothetical protein ACLP22_23695 [Solirubrobacteraceae bacterium]